MPKALAAEEIHQGDLVHYDMETKRLLRCVDSKGKVVRFASGVAMEAGDVDEYVEWTSDNLRTVQRLLEVVSQDTQGQEEAQHAEGFEESV